jgi:hypothetical protein
LSSRILRAGFGDGQIKFFESPFEEVADLGPIETHGTFFFSMGMTITASKGHPQIRLKGLLLPPFPEPATMLLLAFLLASGLVDLWDSRRKLGSNLYI